LYRVLVFFLPGQWGIPGGTVPLGAVAGSVSSVFTYGILGGPCSQVFQIPVTLMNASIDPNKPVSELPIGSPEPLAWDVSPQNGLPDGVDRYPVSVRDLTPGVTPRARLFGITRVGHFAVYNLLMLEPGAHLNLGHTSIDFDRGLGYPIVVIIQNPVTLPRPDAMSDICAPERQDFVLLGRTLNNPCSPGAVAGANCPGPTEMPLFQRYPLFPCERQNSLDEDGDGRINDGCPPVNFVSETGTECENGISDDPEDSSINDGCPVVGPVSEGERIPGTCSAGDEGGCGYLTNPPSAGQQTMTIWAESPPDADDDGIDNTLDTCALIANGDWNPRGPDPENDPDNDGLPDECDPFPSVRGFTSPLSCPLGIVGIDEDQDCFANRHDNCPTVNQLLPGGPVLRPDNTDSDGDSIGDACDPAPDLPDGEAASLCLKLGLSVGAPPTPVLGSVDPLPGPGCADPKHGDIDCSGAVNAIDALKVLRYAAQLPNQLPPGCAFAGDVDCSGVADATDALALLRYSAALPDPVNPECAAIGS
jgi:hypothetical protein